MILGTGIDLVEIGRVASIYERYGEKFLAKIMTAGEIAALPSLPAPYIAARFAAKEAAAKALGTGFAHGVEPRQIEVARNASGAPELRLLGKAQEFAESLGVARCHVSLSHERSCAIALVILEGK